MTLGSRRSERFLFGRQYNIFMVCRDDMTPQQRVQTYYGYAFESWCTASRPDAPSGWGGDVDTSVQWCRVVKTKLGDTRIVIGGEVDCVKSKGCTSPSGAFDNGGNKTAAIMTQWSNSKRL